MTHVIEAEHYRIEVERLKADPIIREMVDEVASDYETDPNRFEHEDGSPCYELMLRSGDEYRRRGGKHAESIGGPAKAVLALLKER